MLILLSVGISIALPQPASATVVGWRVTNWCAPVACTPGANYYDGMLRTTFLANAGTNCSTLNNNNNNTPTLVTNNGGYLNPPDGLFTSDKFSNLRWVFGEPLACTEGANPYPLIPFRYFKYDPVAGWVDQAATGTAGLGASICAGYPSCVEPKTELTCTSSTGTTITWNSTGTNAQGGASVPVATWKAQNSQQKTSDGKLSYRSIPYTINGLGLTSGFYSATNCFRILNFTMTVPTDTIGGSKKVQWSGARASNGVENTWSDDFETLNCNIQNPPQECIGQNTTPYLISCGKLTIDPGTWGELGPCILGTPADYIKGIGALDETLPMPLPGTGSCAAWTVGSFMGTPFVIDMCGWYPAARPVIDLLMTAGLWIAVVGSVFRTRTGEGT